MKDCITFQKYGFDVTVVKFEFSNVNHGVVR